MISRLRRIRLSWSQLITVATTSALATVLIISAAVGHPPVPSAVVAALRHRIVVHRTAATPAPVPTAAPAPPATPAAPVASSAPVASASASASSSDASDSDSSDSSDSSGSSDSTSSSTSTTSAATNPPAKPTYKVKHVFVIALSTTSYKTAWGHDSVATYLNSTLRPKGTLLSGYRTLGGTELPDYLAMISGQAPNPDTRADCSTYADFPSTAKADAAGQMSGRGCIYPSTVLTIGDQVTATGKTWKAYVDDMGNTACVHPNSDAVDDTQLPGAGAQYATRHNPFIYFHSLLDLGDCSNDDVSLDRLPADLRTVAKTPTYSFISPGLCDDASEPSCPGGRPGGLAGEDAFLKLWVPRILSSPAYKRDGALIILFASTPAAAPASTSTSATTSPTSTPTTTSTTTTTAPAATPSPAAGGDSGPVRTGALVLSPYAARGKALSTAYGPYSLLRSLEDLFGYTPLVNAAKAKSFVKSALPDAETS